MSDWTDELKQELITAYEDKKPTPENSAEIVVELATEFEKTPNGVRMILSKAGVYVKKDANKSTATGPGTGNKPSRISKADAIADLTSAIQDLGQEVDAEILGKLTGKAASYFAGVIRSTSVDED